MFKSLKCMTVLLCVVSIRVLKVACSDSHPDAQNAALKTLRLFCRNPECRQVGRENNSTFPSPVEFNLASLEISTGFASHE